jgi:preprotein translocase subunit YajC
MDFSPCLLPGSVVYSAFHPTYDGGGRTVLIDLAYAQGGQPGGGAGGLLSSLFLFLPLILIFYFLIFRPQQKQRKEAQQMLANLKRGDRVVTRGGVIGTIDKVEEQRLRLDLGTGLKLHVQRDYIDRVEKGQRGAESAD